MTEHETADLRIVTELRPDPRDAALLRDELYRDLAAKGVPPEHRRSLACYLRDAEGQVVGGAEGDVRWDWLKLDNMWVRRDLRGRGFGTRLLAAFEELGATLGCRHARTSTYSFQAPGFYQGLGYAVLAEYPDYPPGHSKVDLVKHFHETTGDASEATP